MDNTYHTTEHRKGQHLLSEERHEIEVRRKDGWSIYRIAKHLGRPYNTIKNEIKRGTVSLYNGKVRRYKADEGETVYLERRQNCRRQYRCLATIRFLQYVVKHFKGDEKWSLDACCGKARESKKFRREEMVCTKTLYNYVDLGLLPIKNIDLPEKLRRNTKSKKAKENKRILGKSIEERPEIVDFREEFGHWELDSVIGKKTEGEPVVITLTERTTRQCIWLKVKDYSAEAVNEALKALFDEFGGLWHEVFKTITADSGSEFALPSELEDEKLLSSCLRQRNTHFTVYKSDCRQLFHDCRKCILQGAVTLTSDQLVAPFTEDVVVDLILHLCNSPDYIGRYVLDLPEKFIKHTVDRLSECRQALFYRRADVVALKVGVGDGVQR